MRNFMFCAVVLVILAGCTDSETARNAVRSQGMTNFEFTGYNFMACGEDDFFYHTGFRATNRNGETVTGTVCSGLIFKGATIRY